MTPVDVAGDAAVRLLEIAYMVERFRTVKDEERLQELRDAITLSRGWKFSADGSRAG